MGFRMEELIPKPTAGGYFARFRRIVARPDPSAIIPCAINQRSQG
ncbi:MAG: SAM-dependent methyltransferase, partial [Pseudomonadota bacterium]|nr:SAM-dependent methyltransferase [Pseudomonadota bacterium]